MGQIDERPPTTYSVRLTKGRFIPAFERRPARPSRQLYAYQLVLEPPLGGNPDSKKFCSRPSPGAVQT